MFGHDELPELDFKFLNRLRRRSQFRVAMAYLGTAWFIFHVVTVIGETFAPIHHFMRGFAYLLAAGLPFVLRLHGWGIARPGPAEIPATVEYAERVQAPYAPARCGHHRHARFAIVALAADRCIFHRPVEQSMSCCSESWSCCSSWTDCSIAAPPLVPLQPRT